MLGLGSAAAIYLYDGIADMRCGFDGLLGLVERQFELAAFRQGALFVVVSRRRTQVKVLWSDGDGCCLWTKRLSQGCFRGGFAGGKIERRDLMLLLEGVHPQRLNKRWKP